MNIENKRFSNVTVKDLLEFLKDKDINNDVFVDEHLSSICVVNRDTCEGDDFKAARIYHAG